MQGREELSQLKEPPTFLPLSWTGINTTLFVCHASSLFLPGASVVATAAQAICSKCHTRQRDHWAKQSKPSCVVRRPSEIIMALSTQDDLAVHTHTHHNKHRFGIITNQQSRKTTCCDVALWKTMANKFLLVQPAILHLPTRLCSARHWQSSYWEICQKWGIIILYFYFIGMQNLFR